MKQFEYHIDHTLGTSDLNRLGLSGWELVSIQRDYKTAKHWFYFKREKIK